MSEKKYSKDHEWVSTENDIATVGITNLAQESLGDIVFIELPEVGKIVNVGEQVGVVESVKAASELFSPISGKIIQVNDTLSKEPHLINSDAENIGWYMKIEMEKTDELGDLMDISQYKKIIN